MKGCPSVSRRLWDRRATYLSESALSAAVFAPAVDAADELLATLEELELEDDDDPTVNAVAILSELGKEERVTAAILVAEELVDVEVGVLVVGRVWDVELVANGVGVDSCVKDEVAGATGAEVGGVEDEETAACEEVLAAFGVVEEAGGVPVTIVVPFCNKRIVSAMSVLTGMGTCYTGDDHRHRSSVFSRRSWSRRISLRRNDRDQCTSMMKEGSTHGKTPRGMPLPLHQGITLRYIPFVRSTSNSNPHARWIKHVSFATLCMWVNGMRVHDCGRKGRVICREGE
jgi:hypothetical protein